MKVVIFGAGDFASEFIVEVSREHEVIALVDNDVNKQNRTIKSRKVYAPSMLTELAPEGIVLGCLPEHHPSILEQLDGMGFAKLVLRNYPSDLIRLISVKHAESGAIIGKNAIDELLLYSQINGSVVYDISLANKLYRFSERYLGSGKKKVFHAGSSRSLGVEIYSSLLWGWSWSSVEPFPLFIDNYPFDEHYGVIKKFVSAVYPIALNVEDYFVAHGCSNGMWRWQLGRSTICYFPQKTLESASLVKGEFDIGFSWAVLEHVVDVDSFVKKCAESLKPGGICIHGIDLRDHIDFDNPLDHLKYNPEGWNKRLASFPGYYGNQLRISDYRRIFSEAGFDILEETITQINSQEYVDGIRSQLDTSYRHLVDEDLYVAGVEFVLRKP